MFPDICINKKANDNIKNNDKMETYGFDKDYSVEKLEEIYYAMYSSYQILEQMNTAVLILGEVFAKLQELKNIIDSLKSENNSTRTDSMFS